MVVNSCWLHCCWQGIAEGLTYSEFRERYPEEFRKRQNDKYHYRFLYGEVNNLFTVPAKTYFCLVISFLRNNKIFLN